MHALPSFLSPFSPLPCFGAEDSHPDAVRPPSRSEEEDTYSEMGHSDAFTVLSVDIIDQLSSHLSLISIVKLAGTNQWMHAALIGTSTLGLRTLPSIRHAASFIRPVAVETIAALQSIQTEIPEMQPALLRFLAQKVYGHRCKKPDIDDRHWDAFFHRLTDAFDTEEAREPNDVDADRPLPSVNGFQHGARLRDLLVTRILSSSEACPYRRQVSAANWRSPSQAQVKQCFRIMRRLALEHWPDVFVTVIECGGKAKEKDLIAFIENSPHCFPPTSLGVSHALFHVLSKRIPDIDEVQQSRLGATPRHIYLRKWPAPILFALLVMSWSVFALNLYLVRCRR